MQLSKRLESVSSLVTPGFRVADIGTDHGYIPLWLIRQGVIPGAIAMDIHKWPLQRAKENIQAYELEEKIETRLSDGLGELRPGEADCVVIAGMGGSLVIKILKEGAEVLRTVRELVLQPQSDMEKVRRFLQKEGYRITSEKMILEDGKFYPMMRAEHGRMKKLSEIEALYGPCLLKEKNVCLKQFLEREQQTFENVRRSLAESKTTRAKERLLEIEEKIEQIKRAKEKMR